MMNHKGMIVLVAIVVVLLLTMTTAFTVQTEDNVLVQKFGRTARVYRGQSDAGLHFKWPWPIERVVQYDARTFVFEDTFQEINTSDPWPVLVSLFCTWRIDDPVKFQSSLGTIEQGQDRVRTRLRSAKQDVIKTHSMSELVNTDPDRMHLAAIENDVARRLENDVLGPYGIRIAMVGIQSVGLTKENTGTVIKMMQDERQKEIKKLEADGTAQATKIRERADEARKLILAFADRKAAAIRSEGELSRQKLFKDFEKNPELAVFIRRLDTLKNGLKDNTVIVLDGSELPQVKWFRKGPGEELKSARQANEALPGKTVFPTAGTQDAPGPGSR